MTYINKIRISNARRFGENVDIDFGKGATILLAPNGTGKTTVFEAIELALTGKLDRVGHPPYALVRDLQAGLDIRLDFDNDLFCQVNFQKEKDIILTGDHSKLFGDKIDSIPYLLRLTHLLEQRGKDWFVSAAENEAGSQLDKLSIGKELNKAYLKKQSTTTALNKEETRIEYKLSRSKEALANFKSLLEERSKLTFNIDLIPLPEIASQLGDVASSITLAIGDKPDETLNSIMAFCEKAKVIISHAISDNLQKEHQYAELNSLLDLYINNELQLTNKTKEKEEKSGVLTAKELSYNGLKKELEQKYIQLRAQQDSLIKIKAIRDFLIENDLFLKEKSQITKELKELNGEIIDIKPKLKVLDEELQITNKLIDSHNIIAKEIEKNEREKTVTTGLNSLQKQWEQTELKIKKIQDETIPFIKNQIAPIEEALGKTQKELEKAISIHGEKELQLAALNQASNEIHQAISVIASNITDETKDCPVCEADYPAGELHKRITNALNKINPLIAGAVNDEKSALSVIDEIRIKINEHTANLKNLTDDQQEQRRQLALLIQFIEDDLLPNFENCKNAQEAFNFIAKKSNQLDERMEVLRLQKLALNPEPTTDSVNNLKLNKGDFERQIIIKEDRVKLLNEKLIKTEQVLTDLQAKIEGQSLDTVQSNIAIIENVINTIKNDVQLFENSQGIFEKEIKDLKNSITELTETLAKLKSQQDGVQNKWTNSKLDGNPSKSILDEAKQKLAIENEALNKAKINIEKIDYETSRWRSAEAYLKLDREIKEQIKPQTEELYLAQLQNQVKVNEQQSKDFKAKRKTLDAFFSNTKKELDTIHKHIMAVNPAWTKLLKRIVIDSRFSDKELLSSGTYYNKPFAKIQAGLHNEQFDVTKIASEAQLTDLQLTFMLTMAKKHQWTPWKALLLDDPTQHHDLVHASSVFDLLRDYIVDLDFQIMMSTHDSTQASFFYRKLQNDGIEAKIYRLNSADKGVVAERIK